MEYENANPLKLTSILQTEPVTQRASEGKNEDITIVLGQSVAIQNQTLKTKDICHGQQTASMFDEL